ncbi:hypothetical protein FJT64_008803 [Amphibalanus amphitrite]|uniref:Uncharacterized protein n=1 Tax=Amphibalanus amphitrite TaxID=1232801 RepID=A0A6A4VRU1_AMPAM|nr:hypothetical protein FJT64_008803 [Amphibalanus amphitrite]
MRTTRAPARYELDYAIEIGESHLTLLGTLEAQLRDAGIEDAESTHIADLHRAKYFYLKQHLDGDAARAIQGLPLTAENYPEAVRILQHRFGKDDVRKDTLVAKLLSLPGVTDADNIKSLRKLTDEVTAGVRSLRALDITNIGEVLLPVLKGKIPASWRLQWARLRRERATDDENTEFESFLRFLQQEVECQEESVQVLCQKKREESSQPANRATTKQPEGLEENIELADDFSGGQVDILIGTDQYYKVVLRDCVACRKKSSHGDTVGSRARSKCAATDTQPGVTQRSP